MGIPMKNLPGNYTNQHWKFSRQ